MAQMDIVSWNMFGLEASDLDARTEAAVAIALLGATLDGLPERPPPLPDALLLQEVVPRSFHAHLAPHLRAAGYTLYPDHPPERGYFEVIATRAPPTAARTMPFPRTGMGRALHEVRLPGLTLLTAHLESLSTGRALRVEQAAFVLDRLLQAPPGPVVFGGDTNLRDDEWAALDVPPGVTDAWEALGRPAATAHTYARRRYDRFWLRDAEPTALATLGDAPLPCGQPPSDHRGLRLSVSPR